MSELRRDPTTNGCVIIAPERNRRPRNRLPACEQIASRPSLDPTCPFCPGNESMLPSIIAETASNQRPGWRTRIVGNRFPAVRQDNTQPQHGPFYETAAARGHHEVIIESPRHDKELTTLSADEIHDVVITYRSRYVALMAEEVVQSAIVFRNRGRIAGASLGHPHSQVITLEIAPPFVRARQSAMRNYYRENGRCIICDLIAFERAAGSRVVGENEAFLTLVPFAATAPCEMWLLPTRHQADFSELATAEIDLLAMALQDALLRLSAALNDPPYNYVIDTATKAELGSPSLHWRLRVVPQTTVLGGFEFGSGLPINPSLPERDAALLRASGSIR